MSKVLHTTWEDRRTRCANCLRLVIGMCFAALGLIGGCALLLAARLHQVTAGPCGRIMVHDSDSRALP